MPSPVAPRASPAVMTTRGPNLGSRRLAEVAPAMTPSENGRKARPLFMAE